MGSSVRPVAPDPASPRSALGRWSALMPRLSSPRRRAAPWISQPTEDVCDVRLTRALPLVGFFPGLGGAAVRARPLKTTRADTRLIPLDRSQFIRSGDESISHAADLSSSMTGFSSKYGYYCSDRRRIK